MDIIQTYKSHLSVYNDTLYFLEISNYLRIRSFYVKKIEKNKINRKKKWIFCPNILVKSHIVVNMLITTKISTIYLINLKIYLYTPTIGCLLVSPSSHIQPTINQTNGQGKRLTYPSYPQPPSILPLSPPNPPPRFLPSSSSSSPFPHQHHHDHRLYATLSSSSSSYYPHPP